MPFNLLVLSCVLYVAFLFTVAFVAEGRAARGRVGWLRSPLVYTLSLWIYCTAWTFYGAGWSVTFWGLVLLAAGAPLYVWMRHVGRRFSEVEK